MTVTIHLNTFIYIIISLVIFALFIDDFCTSYSGGMFSSGKNKYSIGAYGILAIILEIIFTLIWGGFFWW